MKRQKAKIEEQRGERERKRRFEEALWNPPSYCAFFLDSTF